MRLLVTGSSGHLGEALVRVLRERGHDVLGLDVLPSAFTNETGSILDRALLRRCLEGREGVLHAATLHKPHVATHSKQAFVDVNVTGTLAVLEESARARVGRVIFTSTTSAFGRALTPPEDAPAAWLTEEVASVPKNVYGVTKAAAEDLCELVARELELPVVVLRTSRFFPEEDDDASVRAGFADGNVKVNELLYRRLDIEDAVEAHALALERAPAIGFAKYVISATTPFQRADLAELRADAPAVVRRLFPRADALYARLGWRMFPKIDRVYVNAKARRELGWEPRWDFARALECLARGEEPRSALATAVGAKGYHRTA